MNKDQLQHYFFIALIAVLTILVFFILRPYLSAVILAVTLAVIMHPIRRWIEKRLVSHRGLAALLSTLIVAGIIIGPLTALGFQVFDETRNFYLRASSDGAAISGGFYELQRQLSNLFPGGSLNLNAYLEQIARWLVQNFGSVFANIGQGLATFFFSLVILFFLLRDSEKLKQYVLGISPLPDKFDLLIIEKAGSAINSVIRGTLILAFTQGLLAGIGFAIFGIPNPALWGSITVFAALVPSVGTALVMIPAILYLFLTRDTILPALGLTIWGSTAVGLIDNFLGPKLIGKGARLHPLIVLFAVLGGISLFGPIGFIIGPVAASLLLALVEMYPEVVKKAESKS